MHKFRFMAIFKLYWVTKAYLEHNALLKYSLVFMAIIVFGLLPRASEHIQVQISDCKPTETSIQTKTHIIESKFIAFMQI